MLWDFSTNGSGIYSLMKIIKYHLKESKNNIKKRNNKKKMKTPLKPDLEVFFIIILRAIISFYHS
jgi:hypothetical protein